MNFRYLIILLLPIILHIKTGPAIVVFLIMNSIISVLMKYSREHMRILGSFIEDGDIMDEHMEQGLSMEESHAIITENFQARDLEEWVPKGVSIAITVTTIISIVGILAGIVNLII